MLEEYEEDNQRLPGDEDYKSKDDRDGCTSEEMDIIHDAERLVQQQDEEASDSEDGSDDDDESNESSDKGNEGDANFIPKLQLKRKKIPQDFRAVGDEQRTQKVKKDANYMFCPLSHHLSILRIMCKHFCQHPILPECHGQMQTPKQIHHDAVLETYYHCKANNLHEVWAYLWTNWYASSKWESWA